MDFAVRPTIDTRVSLIQLSRSRKKKLWNLKSCLTVSTIFARTRIVPRRYDDKILPQNDYWLSLKLTSEVSYSLIN